MVSYKFKRYLYITHIKHEPNIQMY